MLHELSMGMTGDFETAIEEGATIVRVGRDLPPDPGTAVVPHQTALRHASAFQLWPPPASPRAETE